MLAEKNPQGTDAAPAAPDPEPEPEPVSLQPDPDLTMYNFRGSEPVEPGDDVIRLSESEE